MTGKHAKKSDRKINRHLIIVVVATAMAVGMSFVTASIMIHLAVIVPGATEVLRMMVKE